MVHRFFLLIFLWGYSCAPALTAPQTGRDLPADTLARVGSTVITARDLIERIELMPWPGKDRPAEHDSAKIRALQSLVAEQLLAIEASVQGMGNDTVSQWRRQALERLLVRDALYRREIKEKVKLTQADFSLGMYRFARELSLLVISIPSEDVGRGVARALRSTRRPDSVLIAFSNLEAVRWDTAAISLGSIERNLEDAAYRLNDSSRVSAPVRSPSHGWFLLYYRGVRTNPEYARRSLAERRSFVENAMRLRKEGELSDKFLRQLLGPERAEAQPDLFELLATNALTVLKEGPPPGGQGYRFSPMIDTLISLLRSDLPRPFITLRDGTIALGEVLEAFRTHDILIPSLEPERFRRSLNAGIKRIVEGELIARDAYKRGLQETEGVRHDLRTWGTYWLSQELRTKLLQVVSIDDSSLFSYFVNHATILGSAVEVNVREVLSDSLSTALRHMEQVLGGKNIADLARQSSQRVEWAARGGESGYFPVSRMPELGFRALLTDTGIVVGPYKLNEGYTIFIVLGKKRVDGTPLSSIDTLVATVRRAATTVQEQRMMNRYLGDLARKYGVEIDYGRLSRVNIAPSNMVTRRLMGFGGSMTAFPTVTPQWDWVKELQGRERIVP